MRNMLINIDPTNRASSRRPRPAPSPVAKSPQLETFSDFVEVATQLELIRSIGVLVCMCALTQHLYAVPGSNPWTWILVVLVLMLGTLTSWICPSDSAESDVVHDKSYPLMILLSLGIDCPVDHFIITEVESAVIMMEMFCGN